MVELCGGNKNIKIQPNVISGLIKHKQVHRNSEAGGMLIASIISTDKAIEINDFTEPLENDKRSFLGYKRSYKHNEILNQKWQESNYKKLYIGEWHTHPQGIPTPSYQDKISWRKLLLESVTESDYLIFIIVGIRSMGIWVGDRRKRKIERGVSYTFQAND